MRKLLLSIVALLGIIQIRAYTCKVDGICYNLNSGNFTATVTYSGYPYNNDYTGHYGGGLKYVDVQIPSTIIYNDVEYTVTAIGDDAFYDCESSILMSSVTIPSTVTYIGKNAFWKCTNLTSVTIPSSVTTIGGYAFYGSSNLATVTIPNSVTSIGNDAFEATAWYNNKPDGMVYAGKVAYKYKGTMLDNTNVVIEEGTVSISPFAFCLCSGLKNVTIPNSVISIGEEAFRGCSSLTSVTIPNGVASIEASTFSGCSSLTNVNIPNSVITIGGGAFNNCSSLTNITIPNSVTSIVNSAFSGTGFYANSPDGVFYVDKWACGYKGTMPSNTTISLQEGTVGIAVSSFYGFRNLTNVTIPNSVTTIGIRAFSECSGLTSVTIPYSVTSIGNFAFSGCSGLTSVTIPGSAMDIGSSLFSRCSSLASINVSVTDVSAFCNNTLLKSLNGIDSSKPFRLIDGEGNEIIELVIPSSVSSIGDYAFYGCSGLMSVTIPYFVTSIGVCAFFGCSGLTSVTVESDTPVSIYDRTFYPSQDNATLYVPYGSKADYESTDFWKDFKEIVEMKPKCDTPTITFANGRLTFDCETEGVEFKYYISMTVDQSDSGNEVLLPNMTPTYAVSVYATKEGYVNSDVATQVITYQPKMGDVNNDGDITIADAVAVVDLILNAVPEPKFYYSVGTEEVTADNYTTANGAQYKSSLAEIPETLDLSAISQQQAVILLPEGCLPMIRSSSGLVGTTSVSLGNGYMVYTTTSAINGSECTCTVYK